ncbi:site-specific integrase [Nocardia sp. NPDC005366]|uniref:tyrosine-type recombinase/integrase n=1 Tax=Nocardia sp. NPDC005366 TaxID=3156878 RepID=UPI0033A004A6
MEIRKLCQKVGEEKNLRQSTVFSYRRLLLMLGVEDDSITRAEVEALLFDIDNPSTRRATVIAVRSVLGFKIKIPKAPKRSYVLPEESTLRLALMITPHEIRGLMMMYAGLRIGEACAVTRKQVNGDKLLVDRQILELYASEAETGGKVEKVCVLAPVKGSEAEIVIPHWLSPLIATLDDTAVPSRVRESLRRAGKKVGISLNPHLLRHWYATTMLERGAPLTLVQAQMRHSDIAVTLRAYSEHNNEDIHKMFDTDR